MSVVGIRGPSAKDWSYPAAVLKECLAEFLASPDARRPKRLNSRLIGSFKSLFEPAIFYGGSDPDPFGKDVPKQVRLNDPSWGLGVLLIAMKALKRAGVEIDAERNFVKVMKDYHRFLRKLPDLSRLKGEDRERAVEVQKFIVALDRVAAAASIDNHHLQDDDD